MEQKIKSIQKGYGERDIFYSTDTKVAKQYQVEEIKEESKQVKSDIETLTVKDVGTYGRVLALLPSQNLINNTKL